MKSSPKRAADILSFANASPDPADLITRSLADVRDPVVLAVSGGSDSTALLHAFAAARSRGLGATAVAVTVDHDLRAGSSAEAAHVAEMAARLGVAHVTKQWSGPKPSSAIQDGARAARRRLLCETAGEIGAKVILTAHTLDDQLETVAMRRKRGEGAGLAGIAPASLAFNDQADGAAIWIARPLLEATRPGLRNWLQARSVDWIDDPSNDNPAFERIAVRRELASAGPELAMALRYVQTSAADERVTRSREAARLLSFYVREAGPGLVWVDPGVFQAADLKAISLLIRVLAAFCGGAKVIADEDVANHVIEQAIRSGFGQGRKPSRRSSSGSVIDVRKDGVWLLRERRRKPAGQVTFDGRYRPLGMARAVRTDSVPAFRGQVPASLLQQALAAEPLFSPGGGDPIPAGTAARSGEKVRRLINPWPDVVPGFDARLAMNLSIMAGEGPFPPCPVHPDGKK